VLSVVCDVRSRRTKAFTLLVVARRAAMMVYASSTLLAMRTMAIVFASGRGTNTGALSLAGAEGEPGAGAVPRRPEQAARVTERARRMTRGGIW
jgi:hypothetical protein